MTLEVTLNRTRNGLEFHFNRELPGSLAGRLQEYGFKQRSRQPLKWYVPYHLAYINYGEALKQALHKGAPFEDIHIQPSFEPSLENIDNKKFSYVSISLKGRENDDYIIFDPYKEVAAAIATRFGQHTYKEAFKGIEVYPRNYKRDARGLLKEGKVITGITDQKAVLESEKSKEKPLSENEKKDILQAFLNFADKRISEFPQVIITDNELPIMFSGWLRENHPGLLHQKEEIWDMVQHFKREHTTGKPQEKAKDSYTNEHGVYTPQSAGDRYREIEIPIPETAKYKATINTVLGADNLYRSTVSVHKKFGDFYGRSIPLTGEAPAYESLTEAIRGAAQRIIEQMEADLNHPDAILSNEERKRKLTQKAIKAVKQYIAKEVSPHTGEAPAAEEDTVSPKAQQPSPGQAVAIISEEPGKKGDRERLTDLGFKGLFTDQQAFTKPYLVIDLQSRWQDAWGYFEQTYEKPALEQIGAWKSELETLKGKRDKTGRERRKELYENIRKKENEVADIYALIENENIAFQQAMISRITGLAKTLGYTFENEEQTGEFSADISEALFNDRMIEPYYKEPIDKIAGEIVRDFFDKEKTTAHKPETWTLPLEDYLNQIAPDQNDTQAREAATVEHRMAVFNAMIAGHTVSDRVLKDYPRLQESEKFQVGFDGTDFKSKKQFGNFLELTGISPDFKTGKIIDFPTSKAAYLWTGPGIRMITANNPLLKEGYGSFIGMEGKREKVLEAARHIKKLTGLGADLGLQYIAFEDYNFDDDKGLSGKRGDKPPDSGKNGKTKLLADHPVLDTDDGWMMTPLEYQQMKAIEKTGSPMVLNKKDRKSHEAIVKQAIENKWAVPKRVLDQYPWLVEQAAKKRKSKQPEKEIKTSALKKFERFISRYDIIDGHLYDGELKARFGQLGKAALKQLAGYLGLKEYEVKFNKAGVGVSGSVSLMGMFTPDKGIYITLSKDGLSSGVLYRSISHIKDYTGGSNHYFPQSEFATPETIKERVYRLLGLEKAEGDKAPAKSRYDYLDRVIGHLHEKYAEGKRPTKTQIEKLGEELGVPNKGMMWEAAELSWLLWYRQIYKEPLPFEMRLEKMTRFWTNLQPTYAYSDSSKELYRQYSTPCPIAAMIAQYTGMDKTKSVFEPSAGNGLLLLGADPGKTHVNEIDPTRLASLKYQGFRNITDDNAAEPFDESMTKAYDVVVTNPPFSRWEETKTDKEYMVRKYFNGMMGLVRHIRLEHLMAGLALHCMKDDGKAAIIIMGHIYFSDDGYMARYRPFFNWLYRHYMVSDVINLNGFKLYNKQGAIERTMLILVNGRKPAPEGVAPRQHEAPHLYDIMDSFEQLWERIKPHVGETIDILIKQLKIELGHDFLQ